MIGVKKNVIVFFGIFLVGMLFVPTGIPYMVPEAEASNHQTTEAECLGAISNDIIGYYTAATCENPFNVTVNIGQRLRIINPSGSYDGMLPIATYGGLGTYQYSGNVGGVSTTGTITIQNPPDVGVNYVDITTTISGSQVTLTGQVVNNNNFPVKIYGYYHVTDDAGNYVASWLIEGNDEGTFSLPAGSTTNFTTTVCCLPNNDGTQVTPYILQVIRDHVSPYSLPSGTPLIDVNVYPAAQSGPPSGTVSTSGINLRSDTGGDCSTVGTWNASTKTCTLTADISMTSNGVGILISSQSWQNDPTETGLILDGNGHTITGTGTSGIDHDGVRITGSSSNITVKNLTITNFKNGINSNFTNGLTITGVTVSSVGSYGIYLYGTDSLTLENNTVTKSIVIYEHNAYMGHGNGSCAGTGLYVAPSTTVNGPIVLKNNTVTSGTITATPTGICYVGNTVDGVSFPVDTTPTAPFTIGNDGGDCQYIGTWEQSSKTCTLTYTSSSIIINTTGHGIIIDGHDITLDGSSNKIYGDGGEDDFGVDVRNSDNFTIKDLHIKEFGIGIRAGNSNGGIITSINLIDNSVDGLYAEYVTALKVTSNNISSNGRNGITLNGGSGSGCSGSGAFVVQGNWVASNTGNGIEAFNHSGICFDNNTANVNGYGFYILGSQSDIFTSNTAIQNINTGFHFGNGAAPVTFTDNTASGNGLGDFEGITISNVDLALSNSGAVTTYPSGTPTFSPGMGTGAQLQSAVTNSGTGTASDVKVHVKVLAPNGTVFDEANVLTGVAVGPNNSHGFAWFHNVFADSVALGTYTYTLTIDPDNLVAETDETNNVYTGTFEVVEGVQLPVDLALSNSGAVTTYPSGTPTFSPGMGTGAQLQSAVTNSGTGTASDVKVHVKVLAPNGTVFDEANVLTGVAVGPNNSHGFAWFHNVFADSVALGTYTYTLTIDPDNLVAETDETNNVYTGTFEVVEGVQLPVDLALSNSGAVTTYPSGTPTFSPGMGTGAQLQSAVTNSGTGTASDVKVHVKVLAPNGTVFDEANVLTGVAVGPNNSHGFAWFHNVFADSVALGTYTYTLTIDPDNLVAETDETNNVYTGTFEVVDPNVDTTPPEIYVQLSGTTPYYDGDVLTQYIPNMESIGSYNFWQGSIISTDNVGVTSHACTPDITPISGMYQNPSGVRGHIFPLGNNTITCTASDAAENIGSMSFSINLVIGEDTTPSAPYTITDDATGGDCWYIGTWVMSDKTCTINEDVTVDLSGGIIIGSDGITLDGGNNYGIYGTATGTGASAALAGNYGTDGGTVSPDGQYGILIDGKANVTIRNIGAIQSFHAGIVVKNANNVDILSNSISNIHYSAMQVVGSSGVTMTSNTISNVLTSSDHGCAVQISSSATVTLNQNNISGDGWGYCITNSNGVDIDANNIASNMGAHINGVPESSNIQIRNMQFSSGKEIWIGGCHPSCSTTIVKSVTITGNTFDMSDHAIILDHVQGITISDNIFKNSHSQMVWFMGSDTGGHTITGNTFDNNSGEALRLGIANDNDGSTITGNTFNNNNVAFAIGSKNNQFTNNNFVNNAVDISDIADYAGQTLSTNTFSQNYWSDFDSAAETCYNDTPFDQFCDTTANFQIYHYSDPGYRAITDSQPWVMQDGAMPSSPIPSPPDTQDPSVSTPGSQTFYTTSQSGMIVNYGSVSASDDRGVTSGPTCTHASGTTFTVGNTHVTCTAYDAAGNEGTGTFTITVIYNELDTTDPVVTPPDNIYSQTTNPQGGVVTFSNGTATDNVGVTGGPNCSPASGTMFPIGNSTVTCTAYDAEGNSGLASFWILLTQTFVDSIAPNITTPSSQTITTTSTSGKTFFYDMPTATDNVGVTSGPNCSPASGTLLPVGVTTITCTASDGSGNTATASFTITVVNTAATGDTSPPTVSQLNTMVKETTLSNGAVVTYNLPTATDDEAVTYGPVCTPSSGSLFSIGSTTVTCIAKDAAGNQGTTSFSIIVVQPGTAIEEGTVSFQLDKSSYFTGDSIIVTGTSTAGNVPVTLQVYSPNVELISVSQVTPESAAASQSSGTQTTVQNAQGSSFEGCEPNCFLPHTVTIDVGETVTWQNPDNVPHTATSGSPFTGPDGYFNSGLISVGSSFSHQFNASGTYDYYCIVHPWMQGGVVVSGSQTASAQPEGSGSFATQILAIGPLWSEDGSYTVKASIGVVEATKTFNFTVRALDAIPFTSVPSNIALSINKSAYTGDETISINVALIGGSAGQPISIEVSDPVGTALFLQTVNTDSQARVSSQFTLPEAVVSGTYTVSTSSKGQLWDLTNSVAFTGIPLEPEILDSSISITNEQGAAVTTYNAGDLGYFSTKMTTKSTSQILVTVSVLDAQLNTLGVGFFKTVLPKGDAEIVLGFEIPEGTISGDAQVFTNFFTDWPDQGGISIGEEVSSKVNIIGVEPVEEVVEVLEEPVQMQVTVQNAPGSSYPGCEETNSCFLPFVAEIDIDGTVTWENVDAFAHTVTSGTPESGLDGHFDSGLIIVGQSYSNTFDTAGTYDYFCMVHPWMQGQVVVGGSDEVVEPIIEPTPVFDPESVVIPESTSEHGIVVNAPGSSTPGCEETNSCFLPSTVTIDLGGTVTWENTDTAAHTATAGTAQNGPSGHFDSSLMMAGGSFSHTFDAEGTYDYFCMVHPWMTGQVVVGESDTVVEPVIEEEPIPESSGMQATVQNAPGSSFEGCEPNCFLPSTVIIDLGGTVTWENPDDVPHTMTSGTSADGPSGHFDSSLIMTGGSFSNTFDESGTYDYFCMIHPWMTGTVIVGFEEVVAAEAADAAEAESSGMQATVQNAPGSSFQGCEPCFLPSTVTIDLGGTVTWENPDNAAHSTASFIGSISGVVGLEWNSGLMLKDQSFSHTFDTEGTYDYFCMVHPWMQGIVVVQGEEEEPPPPVQEEIIEVVDILALNGTSNIIFLTGTDYVEANKSSLNDEHEKLTVSSWVKPDFISTSTQQYSAVSKEGSFELFLTNTKDPERSPGFSVFDGQSWNTILIDSKVTEGWHHLAGVVNGEDISLYLDSLLIGTKSIPSQTGYMAASENAITVGTLINSASMPIEILNSFQGSISEVNIITDALTSEQISNLYLTDKDMFQRDFVEVESVINGTVTTTLVTTESPELSADECIELAKERGLYDQVGGSEAYTLVCQFPFDVIIPINSRILWMETLSLENAPYHSIQSVDNLFSTGSMTSADMGFYDDTFTYDIYEYYDNFAESLTGKITISKLTNSININEGSASPECADTNLCYDTFAAQVDVGEEVTWRNMDILTHSVTSGTPGDGPDGLFDSGLFSTYLYFSYTFEEAGTYDYYCTTHPWMQGKVVVGEV